MYVVPGGTIPKRQTDGAIGYDVHIRAVVSNTEMDEKIPTLRKTLFDFNTIPKNEQVGRHIKETINKEGGELVYRMDPGESVLVGIGVIFEMPFPMFFWVAPRSGLSSKHGITVTNAPGTVDPDYRGEAGVLVYNRNNHCFDLTHNMRIAQIIFQYAIIPEITQVKEYADLSDTRRGSGGFGHTGQ